MTGGEDKMNAVVSKVSEAEAQRAYEKYSMFLAHRADAERAFLLMGGDLLYFYETDTWKALGFGSFDEFIQAPLESGGCGVDSYRTAMRWIAIYRRYVRELRCREIDLVKVGVYKLDLLLPHVNEDNVADQLSRGISQSRNDLESELRNRPDPTSPPVSPPLHTLYGRPIRLWPIKDAPIEFRNLFPGITDVWIAHYPPEHIANPLDHIGSFMRKNNSRTTLKDGSEVYYYE